jgi:hypothetical protein
VHVRAATITVAEVEELVEAGNDLIKFIFLNIRATYFQGSKYERATYSKN